MLSLQLQRSSASAGQMLRWASSGLKDSLHAHEGVKLFWLYPSRLSRSPAHNETRTADPVWSPWLTLKTSAVRLDLFQVSADVKSLHYNVISLWKSRAESVTVGGEILPLLAAGCTIKEITFMNFRLMSAWSRHVDFPVPLGWRDTGAIVSTFTGKSIFQACKWSCSRSRRVLWLSDYSYGI